MKKLCRILILVGFGGILSSGLLRLSHIDPRKVLIVSELCFFAGILLLPVFVVKKFDKYLLRQKIFAVTLWVGFLLTSAGHLFRYMRWEGYRSIAIAGYGLILLSVIFVIVIIIGNKLRTSPVGKPVSPEALAAPGLTDADLGKFVGVYTNDKIPLKITITQFGGSLIAQATDQAAFYLEVVGKKEFKYYHRDILLEFDTAKNEMILKQHGGFFLFAKEP